MEAKKYIGNVLIVDDQPVNLSLMEKILKDLPVRILKAKSGPKAIEIAEKEKLALILLDVQMPVMDGFETADKLKQIEHIKTTPIIFITAVGSDTENINKGYKSGCVDYIIKPVTPLVLRSKVQIFLDMNEKYEEIDQMLMRLEAEGSTSKEKGEHSNRYSNVVPLCSWCRKIRNNDGEWEQVEAYIKHVAGTDVTHSVCPACAQAIRGQMKKT